MRRRTVFVASVLTAAGAVLCASAQGSRSDQPVGVPVGAPPALAPEFQPLGQPPLIESSPLGTDGRSSSSGGTIASTAASLAAVIGLVVVCAGAYRWLAQRSGALSGQPGASRAPGGIIDVLGRYPVGRGQTLLLMQVDRRVLLVAQSVGSRVGVPPSMATLCEIVDPDEVAAIIGKASGGGFGEVLSKANAEPAMTGRSSSDGVEVVDLTGGSLFSGGLNGGLRGVLGAIGGRR